ncbi:MAG TPA: hypothetical protein VKY85_07610 [Candidatus Angelobacter sp.]|nr:hypothetical protein [Candidatus Angelobacter sp.]
MTANDLIASALRLIGVLASGEVPTAAEANDGLTILNQMIDSWGTERLALFTIQRQVVVPAVLKQAYTLGAGGDFNLPRPPRVDRVGVISLTNAAQPLELPLELLTDAGWQAIPVKNITSSLPLKVWNDLGFPLMTLNFWPIPNVQVNFALYTWTALTQFPDLVTDETFPPGYMKALRYNLAVDLAPEFGRSDVPPVVAAQAVSSKAVIKALNIPLLDLRCDTALVNQRGGHYNWITDGPVSR